MDTSDKQKDTPEEAEKNKPVKEFLLFVIEQLKKNHTEDFYERRDQDKQNR